MSVSVCSEFGWLFPENQSDTAWRVMFKIRETSLRRPRSTSLEYNAIEAAVEEVIAQKFDLAFPTPSQVKTADNALLRSEVFTFFGAERYFEDFGEEYVSRGEHLFGFDPATAESKFLHLYSRLTAPSQRSGGQLGILNARTIDSSFYQG